MNKVESIDDIITAWERCNECRMHPVGLSQAYLDCKYTIGLYCGQDKLVWHTLDLLKELKKQPEIVRCKECIHRVKEPNGVLYCDNLILSFGYEQLWYKKVTEEWYCADGERRDKNDE